MNDGLLDDAPDMTAGEFALGLLDGEERTVALRRMLAEPGFAQQVERWRMLFAPLFGGWPEMAPPAGALHRIDRMLDGEGNASARARPPRIVTAPARRLWPAATAVLALAAAALLLVMLIRPAPRPPGAVVVRQIPSPPAGSLRLRPPPSPVAPAPAVLLVASIVPVAKGAPVTAVYDPVAANLRLTPTKLAGAAHSAQLWIIAGDGVPHSLGLLRSAGASVLAVGPGDRARLASGSTLAVSLEPVGGSPTASPTGPVVAKGALSHV